MDFSGRNLRRLSNLELSRYSGDLFALEGNDLIFFNRLVQTPVRVAMVAQRGICDEEIYELCERKVGDYPSFADLRESVVDELIQRYEPLNWNRLAVLIDGIFVGDPEDIHQLRAREPEGIMYPVSGLGAKLADVTFKISS